MEINKSTFEYDSNAQTLAEDLYQSAHSSISRITRPLSSVLMYQADPIAALNIDEDEEL